MNDTTEVRRVRLEKVRISKVSALRVNMVDLNQPVPEMEELEMCLMLEKEKVSYGYQKANKSLR